MPENPLLDVLKDLREQLLRLVDANKPITIDQLRGAQGDAWRYTFRARRNIEERFGSLAARCGALLRRSCPTFFRPTSPMATADVDLFYDSLYTFAGDRLIVIAKAGFGPVDVLSASPPGPRVTLQAAEVVALTFIERWIGEVEALALPEPPTEENDYVTQERAAAIAQVSSQTIRRWIRAGGLKKRSSDSRVRESELVRVMESLKKRRPRPKGKSSRRRRKRPGA